MSFIIENKAVVLGALLALSEVLALIPSLKANSIFELNKAIPYSLFGKGSVFL